MVVGVLIVVAAFPFTYPHGSEFLKGANYRLPIFTNQPSAYSSVQVESDLQLLKGLGGNLVEIYVPYLDHNYSIVKDFLGVCEKLNLHVIVTFFDWASPFQDVESSKTYLSSWINEIKHSQALYALSLMNEINLRDGSEADKENWLIQMAAVVRSNAYGYKLTVEYQIEQANSLELLAKTSRYFDFVCVSYFMPIYDFGTCLNRVKTAAPNTPILLSEFGLTNQYAGTQEAYFVAMFEQIRLNQNKLVGCSFWALKDYPEENHYGVFSDAGVVKPAAMVVQQFFGLLKAEGER